MLFGLLPVLGAGALIVLAQLQVKERSERAALGLTIGGGLEVAWVLTRQFVPVPGLVMLSPLVQVGAVGAVVFGLVTLANELNPARPPPLPLLLANNDQRPPNVALRVTLGVFGMMGVLSASLRSSPLMSITGMLAIAGALAGSVWIERQGPLARWVLQRRPDLVAWSYVYQLRMVNRRTGSSTIHWSAQLGLTNGRVVPLPAASEQHAQTLVGAVAERCPGVVLGFTAENSARFKSSPEAMRGGARP